MQLRPIWLPILCITASSLLAAVRCTAIVMVVVNLLYGLLLFFMHVQTDLFWAIIGHGLSSTLLSLLVAVPVFVLAGNAFSQSGFSARSRGTRYKGLR